MDNSFFLPMPEPPTAPPEPEGPELPAKQRSKAVSLTLQILLEAQKSRAARIKFEPAPEGQDRGKISFFVADQDGKSSKLIKSTDFAAEDLDIVCASLSQRCFSWPLTGDLINEKSIPGTTRFLCAPLSPFRLVADFVKTKKNSSLIAGNALENIRWANIKPITSSLSLDDKQRQWLLSAAKSRNGIILTNKSPDRFALDGAAIVLAIRPDAIFYPRFSDSQAAEIVNLASDHLVVVSQECLDPVDMIFMFISHFSKRRDLLRDCCQRLLLALIEVRVKQVCGACAKSTQLVPETLERIPVELRKMVNENYMFGRGCAKCGNSAYQGNIGLNSIIGIDKEMQVLLFDKISAEAFTFAVYRKGTRSLLEDGLAKINAGLTSFEQVLSVTQTISPAFARACCLPPDYELITRGNELNNPKKFLLGPDDTQPAIKTKRARLLIIEDEIEQRDVLLIVFSTEGYEVLTAEHGAKALELLSTQQADLILCDVMMPVMNGKEFLSKLRENPNFTKIPVIILTAAENVEDENYFLANGANDYCSKGIKRKALLQRISNLLSDKPTTNPVEHLLSD